MNKKGYMMILACCLLLCAGCSADEDAGKVTGIERLDIDMVQESGSESIPAQEDDRKSIDSLSMQSGLNQFEGLDEIQYAGGDRLLLFADRIYLYELTGQKVIAETEYPDSNGGGENIRTWIMDSGYCIAYEAVSESSETETGITESVIFGEGEAAITGSFHIIYAYYDTDLNFQKTIDVTALGADVNFIHQTAPSGDGRQIAVCEQGKGISLYDVNTLEKVDVLQVDGKEYVRMGGLSSVNQVAFAENDSRIVFLGNCIENGKGYVCYGSVKTDGSSLAVHRENTFDIMNVFADHTVFSEELPDDRTSGQVWIYYPFQDISQMVQLSEKTESSHVWGSDTGNYFITAVGNDNVGWTLRLYDIRTLKLVSTKVYEVPNTDDYREPHICYLEEQQIAVLFQRPYGENEQYKVGIVSFQ